MNSVTMFAPRAVGEKTHILPAFFPVPMLGLIPVNAFLIGATEPVLVDTGLFPLSDEFMAGLRSILDLDALRWIWLTHVDADHIGSLERILAAAPRARVVTTFLGLGKYNLRGALPPDRVHLLNPGQQLDVGDRTLLALRPATYDAPETTALFDMRTRTLFSSDSYGAVLDAPVEDAAEIPAARLRDGSILWATIEAPWLQIVVSEAFERVVESQRALKPELVLSSHLPPARGMMDTLSAHLLSARGAAPFVGPDQAAMIAAMRAADVPEPRVSQSRVSAPSFA